MSKLQALEQMMACDWPPGSDRLILEALRSHDDRDRHIALGLAGETLVMNDAIADALIAILESRDVAPDDRGTAAIALGPTLEECDTLDYEDELCPPPISQAKFSEVRAALQRVWRDGANHELVRRRAIEASVRAPEGWHEKAIREAFDKADSAWRLTAVFCAGYVCGFTNEVVDALDSKDHDLVLEAVRAADNQGMQLAGPALLSFASAPQTPRPIREAAIEALGHVDIPGRRRVLEELTIGRDAELADIAQFALAEMHDFAPAEEWDDADDEN